MMVIFYDEVLGAMSQTHLNGVGQVVLDGEVYENCPRTRDLMEKLQEAITDELEGRVDD